MVLGQEVPSVKPRIFCPKAPSSIQKQGSPPVSSPPINLPHWFQYTPTSHSWPGLSLFEACPWLPCAPKLLAWALATFPNMLNLLSSSAASRALLQTLQVHPTPTPSKGVWPLSLSLATLLFRELSLHKLFSFYLPFRSPPHMPLPPGSLLGASGEADHFLFRVHAELASWVPRVVCLDGVGCA